MGTNKWKKIPGIGIREEWRKIIRIKIKIDWYVEYRRKSELDLPIVQLYGYLSKKYFHH